MYRSYSSLYRRLYGYRSYYRRYNRLRWGENRWRPYWDYESDSEPESEPETSPTPAPPAPDSPAPVAPDSPAPAPAPEVKPYTVTNIDYNVKSNRLMHHTLDYENSYLIVRRGQEFNIAVTVDGSFDKGEDEIRLLFSTGTSPQQSKGTQHSITPGEKIDIEKDSAVIEKVDKADNGGSEINLSVTFPCDAVIGSWSLVVILRRKEHKQNDRKYVRHKHTEKLYVLFNAWCKEDDVYLDSDDERDEYCMSAKGRIWVGSHWSSRPWNFGHFENDCFEGAFYILDKSYLKKEFYCNPVQVTRALSSMVNSNDRDGGILTGNWSGEYKPHTSPTEWVGSVKIMEEFMASKKAVKYGQCWVFSGVLTTVTRALGIPSRSVTNFDSAHDSDLSMTIDKHYKVTDDPDDTPEPSRYHHDDSVWNFHVWNEAFMKRPDLPSGNDGWQAYDSTPQELSEGSMRCGPSPVSAIKEGNVFIGYDTKFIFGEVNGDRVTWHIGPDGIRKAVKVDSKSVGTNISTKSIGSNKREDVTSQYKHPEGSAEERAAVKRALQHSSRKRGLRDIYNVEATEEVKMTFKGEMTDNADANFTFTANNTANETRTVNVSFDAHATYYTGISGNSVQSHKQKVVVEAEKEETVTFTIKAAKWINKVEEDAMLGMYCLAKVKETRQTFTEEQSYNLNKPEIVLELPSQVKVGEEFEVTMKFTNPLEVPLFNNSMIIEAPGIVKSQKIRMGAKYEGGAEVKASVKLTAKLAGNREIMVTFHCRQLVNINGEASIVVVE